MLQPASEDFGRPDGLGLLGHKELCAIPLKRSPSQCLQRGASQPSVAHKAGWIPRSSFFERTHFMSYTSNVSNVPSIPSISNISNVSGSPSIPTISGSRSSGDTQNIT